MTAPVVVEAARTAVNADVNHVELVIGRLRSAMEELVECDDNLRVKTAMMAMRILNDDQIVRVLAAFAHFHQTVRIWGMERDI
ncbi:hypothetical protein LOK49_LG01G00948 [Camellia lanceoleosa]|uniref:Uncharacterized protein n=1 Tax=Camellia lanceoleosa TaxID=1840588 RepID=A0ACC0J365_9ERIC|nr:hypothetical protein LOK49_LG01G00948 [Camellia lanceoleosa]